jgi:hypothetical protein
MKQMNQENQNKRQERWQEQKAPLKNTDHAFVKVRKDGSPELPTNEQKNNSESTVKEEPSPRKKC